MDPAARRLWQQHRPAAARPQPELLNPSVACPAPWVSLEIDPSGWVLGCCAGHIYPLGRIGDERLRDIWNGPRQAVLQSAMERWDLSVACAPCRWHLEHGRPDPVAATYDQYPLGSLSPAGPHMMQFALSNRCNLGCVMCNAELSSTIRAKEGLDPLENRFDEQFFADVEQLLPGTRLLKFQGGEPFLIPEHRRIWEMAAKLDAPPRLLITTNGTVFTDTVEWVLDRFEVDISVSVDAATPATYAAVRPGGDLARVIAHLDRFQAAVSAKGNVVHVSYCLMDRNAHELLDFLVWAERFEYPATVNLVSDLGLALHDLDLHDLESVEREWALQEAALTARAGGSLTVNRVVWETQRAQLRSVIEERQGGHAPAPRQPIPPGRELFDEAPRAPVSAERVAEEIAAMRAWAQDPAADQPSKVSVLAAGPDGNILSVEVPQPELGIDDRLLGTDIGELCSTISAADGRPIWIFDIDVSEARTVRTFGLSTTAQRGTPGTILRVVELGGPEGTPRRLLIAADRIYERLSVPVQIRR